MKKLQLGFIHKRDLAIWFGLSKEYFMKSSSAFQKYCEKLKEYADFEIVRAGVNIKKIYVDECLLNLDIDLEAACQTILKKGNPSRLVNGGVIGSASMVAREIIKMLKPEQQKYFSIEKNFNSFTQMIRRVFEKLYGKSPMKRYWVYYNNPEQIIKGELGFKVSAPCIQPYNCSSIADIRELTPQEMSELEQMIKEEEENDEEHSSFQAYQIMLDVVDGVYDNNDKELKQEMRRQAKPFYRAMKKFNKKYGMVYINKGTIYIMEERV